MKIVFLVTIFIFCLTTDVFSDVSGEGEERESSAGVIKLMGGISYEKQNFEVGDTDGKLNFTGGIGVEVGRKEFRFDSNLLFSMEKSKFENDYFVSTYNMYSLSLPMMVKLKFAQFNSPYILAGFQGTLMLMELSDDESFFWDGKADFLIDYGVVLGAGMEIDINGASILLEGRLNIGLAELELEEFVFKSNRFVLLFGIRFW